VDGPLSTRPARAELEVGLIGIVRAAPKLDIADRRLAAFGVGLDVVELDEAAFPASASVMADERATTAVPDPDRALHARGDMARLFGSRLARARPVGRGELLARQVIQQRGERPVHDLRRVAGGNGVTEQVLRAAQLLARGG
jgi:hypothetical protein